MAEDFEQQLDDQLREVALPSGFLERLRCAIEDEVLDDEMRRVPLPPGFIDRLSGSPAWPTADEPPIVEFTPRSAWRASTPARFGRRLGVSRFVAAAALTLLLTTVHVLSLTWLLAQVGAPARMAKQRDAIVYFGPLQLETFASATPAVSIAVIEGEPSAETEPAFVPALEVELASDTGSLFPGPAGQLFEQIERDWDPWLDVSPHLLGALRTEEQVAWQLHRSQPRRSLIWSSGLGHSRLFPTASDGWPPVSPTPSLRTIQVPISTSVASFENACAQADRGNWPRPEPIRSEEFVAAAARDTKLPSSDEAARTGCVRCYLSLADGLTEDSPSSLFVVIRAAEQLPGGTLDQPQARLSFDPDIVAAYRVVGYGSPDISVLNATAQGDPLAAGDATGMLVELWLKREKPGKVMELDVSWSDPATRDRKYSARHSISSSEQTPFAQAAPSHQTAVLAAETAAVLTGQPRFEWLPEKGAYQLTPREASSDDLLVASRSIRVAAGDSSTLARLVTLLHQLAAIRSTQGTVAR